MGGGGAVSVWRNVDGEKLVRNKDDVAPAPFDAAVAAAAAEKYDERSRGGRNCWEKAWRRKSASNGDMLDVDGGMRSD
jgi:hypothetical protein